MYPPIAPPTVSVTCQYPGASAQVVAETVAAPIEQQVNGVENMMYMSSQCTNDGNYSLTVTFKHGIDLNLAQVLVQNRVALAMPHLARRHQGDRRDDQEAVARHPAGDRHLFARRPVRPALPEQLRADPASSPSCSRLPGISDVRMFGQRDYSMRIWLDPDKLADPEHDGRRRGRRPARAEPPGGRRPDRPVADGRRASRPRSR